MTINLASKNIYKLVQLLLLIAIFVLLLWSKPWDDGTTASSRTITVTGETTLSTTPDEFVFYPYFQETGTDRDALRTSLTEKANQLVDAVRDLGVSENDIRLDASSYDRWYWEADQEGVLTINLTITAMGDDLVQSVQDYLLTTGAEGQLTPQASFSEAKQKELDAQAVDEASKDARQKAETQANLFGAKLGDVVKIEQGSDSVFGGFPDVIALDSNLAAESRSLPVLPGENEYSQTVTVTYELQ